MVVYFLKESYLSAQTSLMLCKEEIEAETRDLVFTDVYRKIQRWSHGLI